MSDTLGKQLELSFQKVACGLRTGKQKVPTRDGLGGRRRVLLLVRSGKGKAVGCYENGVHLHNVVGVTGKNGGVVMLGDEE